MNTSPNCFWYKECPICDGQGRLIIKRNVALNNLFFCCDECMSCWKNEDDLNHQQNKFMEYSIKSKITNASEEDIRQFHWEKYKIHKCSDTLILSPSENNSRSLDRLKTVPDGRPTTSTATRSACHRR